MNREASIDRTHRRIVYPVFDPAIALLVSIRSRVGRRRPVRRVRLSLLGLIGYRSSRVPAGRGQGSSRLPWPACRGYPWLIKHEAAPAIPPDRPPTPLTTLTTGVPEQPMTENPVAAPMEPSIVRTREAKTPGPPWRQALPSVGHHRPTSAPKKLVSSAPKKLVWLSPVGVPAGRVAATGHRHRGMRRRAVAGAGPPGVPTVNVRSSEPPPMRPPSSPLPQPVLPPTHQLTVVTHAVERIVERKIIEQVGRRVERLEHQQKEERSKPIDVCSDPVTGRLFRKMERLVKQERFRLGHIE